MQPDVPGGILKNSKTPDCEASEKTFTLCHFIIRIRGARGAEERSSAAATTSGKAGRHISCAASRCPAGPCGRPRGLRQGVRRGLRWGLRWGHQRGHQRGQRRGQRWGFRWGFRVVSLSLSLALSLSFSLSLSPSLSNLCAL